MNTITMPIDLVLNFDEINVLRQLDTQHVTITDDCIVMDRDDFQDLYSQSVNLSHRVFPSGDMKKRLPVSSNVATMSDLIGYTDIDRGRVWIRKTRSNGMVGWVTIDDYEKIVKFHIENSYYKDHRRNHNE